MKEFTSLHYAETFGVAHKHILDRISAIVGEDKEVECYFKDTTYINSRNREYPIFTFNTKGLMLLTMLMGTPKGNACKFKLRTVARMLSEGVDIITAYKYVGGLDTDYIEDAQIYTYFMVDMLSGNVKIGRTTNTAIRLKQLQSNNPSTVYFDCTLLGDFEVSLHRELEDYRLNSEWFTKDALDDFYKIHFRKFATVYLVETDNLPSICSDIDELFFVDYIEPLLKKYKCSVIAESIVKKTILNGMSDEEHYKVIYKLAKDNLQKYADSLMLTIP